MDVLTSETCWALSNEIIKQVTSSWSLLIQLTVTCHFPQVTWYLLTSSSSSFLHYYPSFIFPAITCFEGSSYSKYYKFCKPSFFSIVCRIFFSSWTLHNTSSVLTRSVQLISILLQHHISKHSNYIWSICQKVYSGSYMKENGTARRFTEWLRGK